MTTHPPIADRMLVRAARLRLTEVALVAYALVVPGLLTGRRRPRVSLACHALLRMIEATPAGARCALVPMLQVFYLPVSPATAAGFAAHYGPSADERPFEWLEWELAADTLALAEEVDCITAGDLAYIGTVDQVLERVGADRVSRPSARRREARQDVFLPPTRVTKPALGTMGGIA
jgi:hypothetical protein